MDAIDVLGLLTPLTYFVMLGIETWKPAREFPARRGWQWLGVVFLVIGTTIGVVLPLLLPGEWLDAHRLIDGRPLGIVGGTVVGFIVVELAVYVYHRSAHRFGFMWRALHQVHHSALRVDIPGSVLFHPLELVVYVLLQVGVTTLVLGLDPLAAAIVGYLLQFYSYFQHLNVSTPRWLGYVIQRPESHCVHHKRNLHYYNFADLPFWDIVFGTFRNPPRWQGEAGFDPGAANRLGAMLAFTDVNESVLGRNSRGSSSNVSAQGASD
jgi:sterol desaturase/sphingolipid hydroxylase (fatty acid hydroxylase superfamily)